MKHRVEGYATRQYHQPVKRYCQTLDLKQDDALIARYREVHDKANAWPEIRQGIREIGILEMEMYIYENKVFMIVETPLDFDWEKAMEKLATLPRQQEWEDFVADLQGCGKGQASADKWHLMERMFYLYDT